MIKRSCLTAVLFAASALHGQSTWPLIGPAFSASPADLHAASAAVPVEPFAAVTVLLEQDRYSIATDGKVTRVHDLLYRIAIEQHRPVCQRCPELPSRYPRATEIGDRGHDTGSNP